MLKTLPLYTIIFLSAVYISFSQSPAGELVSFYTTSDKDTVKLNRKYGDWWFGVHGGFELLNYFGELNINLLAQSDNPFNRLVNYSTGSGGGYFAGGNIEWKPLGERWGAALSVNFTDWRSFKSSMKDEDNSEYQVDGSYRQLTFSPVAKYHLPQEGLHLFAGLNIEFILSNSYNQTYGTNSSWSYKKEFEDYGPGFGLNAGFGYDFFIADYSNKARILFTPFAEISYRTTMVNENSSSFNSVLVKFGIAIKYGQDNIDYDTMYFDPSYQPKPTYLAYVRNDVGISVTLEPNFEVFPSAYIDYIKPLVSAEAGQVSDSKEPSGRVKAQAPASSPVALGTKTPVRKKDLIVKKGVKETFSFTSSRSVQVSPELKDYLNKVADFMTANPTSRIVIIGHSDNRGSLGENASRAMQRAKNVEKYLLSLNVPQHRIISSWKGSLYGVAPNDTEEGRRQNRRVEIIIEE
ncbi:MAG: OmpA family protein [Candidatus Kapaibacterium sp.]